MRFVDFEKVLKTKYPEAHACAHGTFGGDEIKEYIKNFYNNDFNKDFYSINLIGHGSIMMSNDVDKLKNINIVGRNLPENLYSI